MLTLIRINYVTDHKECIWFIVNITKITSNLAYLGLILTIPNVKGFYRLKPGMQ